MQRDGGREITMHFWHNVLFKISNSQHKYGTYKDTGKYVAYTWGEKQLELTLKTLR